MAAWSTFEKKTEVPHLQLAREGLQEHAEVVDEAMKHLRHAHCMIHDPRNTFHHPLIYFESSHMFPRMMSNYFVVSITGDGHYLFRAVTQVI